MTGLISLLSKGFWGVFSCTTVRFFNLSAVFPTFLSFISSLVPCSLSFFCCYGNYNKFWNSISIALARIRYNRHLLKVPFSACVSAVTASFSLLFFSRVRWLKYWSFSFSVSPSNVLLQLCHLSLNFYLFFHIYWPVFAVLFYFHCLRRVIDCCIPQIVFNTCIVYQVHKVS